MEQEMKHESPETRLIREQNRYIRILEEAQGLIVKLTAQVNHNYGNSSLPSSKCIIAKRSRTTGRRPGRSRAHRRGIPTIRAGLRNRTGS